jgi:hypothetical protein
MFMWFAGLIAIGVSFCDSWSRLTSTTGETVIAPARPASAAAAASATSTATSVRFLT